jgi:serine kinase of HPr protein (carbohydrate metabolism regulator)
MTSPATVHASALLIGEAGVLVRGASGSGKSSLLLSLLDRDRSCRLVADDRVILTASHQRLLASTPAELAGFIEIRGQGIARRPFVSPVVVRLIVDLLAPDLCARLPEAADAETCVDGLPVAWLRVPLGAPDGALRVVTAVAGLV